MSETKVRVLFASDSADAAAASDPLLSSAPDITLIGTAASAEQIVSLAASHQPDVVVIDYDVPGLDAAETARSVLLHDPTVQVIMLSWVGDAGDIRHAMRAGAREYLIRPLQEGELVETIRWLIRERREYARMQAFVQQMRRAYEALFTDDKPIPPKVVAFLEKQVTKTPEDRLARETLAVAYARNRDWKKLAPLVGELARTQVDE